MATENNQTKKTNIITTNTTTNSTVTHKSSLRVLSIMLDIPGIKSYKIKLMNPEKNTTIQKITLVDKQSKSLKMKSTAEDFSSQITYTCKLKSDFHGWLVFDVPDASKISDICIPIYPGKEPLVLHYHTVPKTQSKPEISDICIMELHALGVRYMRDGKQTLEESRILLDKLLSNDLAKSTISAVLGLAVGTVIDWSKIKQSISGIDSYIKTDPKSGKQYVIFKGFKKVHANYFTGRRISMSHPNAFDANKANYGFKGAFTIKTMIKGNLVGITIGAGIDTYQFLEQDTAKVPKEDQTTLSDLLAGIGMSIPKAFLATLLTAAIVVLFLPASATLGTIIIVTIIIGTFVGFNVDMADNAFGITDYVKRWVKEFEASNNMTNSTRLSPVGARMVF